MSVVYTCSPLSWLERYLPAMTVGSGVVLCSRQGEIYVGLVIPHRSPSEEVKKSSCAAARFGLFHHVVTSSSLISSFSLPTT